MSELYNPSQHSIPGIFQVEKKNKTKRARFSKQRIQVETKYILRCAHLKRKSLTSLNKPPEPKPNKNSVTRGRLRRTTSGSPYTDLAGERERRPALLLALRGAAPAGGALPFPPLAGRPLVLCVNRGGEHRVSRLRLRVVRRGSDIGRRTLRLAAVLPALVQS